MRRRAIVLTAALLCAVDGVVGMGEAGAAGASDCNRNGIPDGRDLEPTPRWVLERYYPRRVSMDRDFIVADVDLDGRPDVVSSSSFIGRAHAHWNSPTPDSRWPALEPSRLPFARFQLTSPVVGNFDGGGGLDIAVVDEFTGFVFVTRQVRPRVFAAPASIPGPAEARAFDLLAVDLDGDGDDDLAMIQEDKGGRTLVVYRTDVEEGGAPSFATTATISLDAQAAVVQAGDFNGDGAIDFAVLSPRRDPVDVLVYLMRDGDTWTAGSRFEINGTTVDLDVGDLDADGDDEAIVGNVLERLDIFDGGGTITRRSVPLEAWVQDVVVADGNGDGALDVLLTAVPGFRVLEGDGVGGLSETGVFDAPNGDNFTTAQWVDLDGEGDLDILGYRTVGWLAIVAEREAATSADCDGDGVPDECADDLAASAPLTLDCNENGVDDRCDIVDGESTDRDDDGLVDECELLPIFELSIDAPAVVLGDPGATVELEVPVLLASFGLDPDEPGAQGWVLGVQPQGEGVRIPFATTDGTVAARAPDGLLQEGGFELTGFVCDERCAGAVGSAIVFSFTDPVTLSPGPGGTPVLMLDVEIDIEETIGAEGKAVELSFARGCVGHICRFSDPAPDGAGGAGPIDATVTHEGQSVEPIEVPARIEVRASSFRRGDANDDGRVDISDASRIFNALFLGGARLTCRDAADANDDGSVDISDGVRLLNKLFLGGPEFPAPGRFLCGADPTADVSGCNGQLSCL